MARRKRRVPRYVQNGPALHEREERQALGISADAIKADLSQQAPNNSYGPPLYYRDQPFTCIDCGRDEIWTAAQQQWWYEVAKGPIYSRAKRCRACRAALREAHGGTPRRSHQEQRERGDNP